MTDRFTGASVTIVGLAREGTALARYLAGVGARVTVGDLRTPQQLASALKQIADLPVHLVLGTNRIDDAISTETLFLSPGVPLGLSMVAAAREAGVPLGSEPLLFVERCSAPVVGITGSSGKTTTASLVGEMLRRGEAPRLGQRGNIRCAPDLGHLADVNARPRRPRTLQFSTCAVRPQPAVRRGDQSLARPSRSSCHLDEYYGEASDRRFQRSAMSPSRQDDPEVVAFAETERGSWFSLVRR
ncbi:MAG: hypothetical protein U0556_16350 [Dehalococcoidia bacterium]